ncbi:RWDD1 protein, partial [Polypterus senegalus]
MTDYGEEQKNELEALEAIYPDSFTAVQATFKFTYVQKYPDEPPLYEIFSQENLEDRDIAEILTLIQQQIKQSMVMIFTLVTAVQEKLNEIVDQIKNRWEEEKKRKEKEAEEAEKVVFHGTPVNIENFLSWKAKFELEMFELKRKSQKEEEQSGKCKLTGKQLFERDHDLDTSDIKFLEEAGNNVEVDESLFQDMDDLELEDDDDPDFNPANLDSTMTEIEQMPDFRLIDHKGYKIITNIHSPEELEKLEDGEVYDDDLFVVTYPKSGTIWMQQIMTLIDAKGDLSASQSKLTSECFPWVELTEFAKNFASRPSPRLYCSHLPWYLLPKGLRQKKGKIIYVSRNPKDVLTSYYHFHFFANMLETPKDFEDFLDKFIDGRVNGGSWFDHIRGWYSHKDEFNILFLTYEELIKWQPSQLMGGRARNLTVQQYSPGGSLEPLQLLNNGCEPVSSGVQVNPLWQSFQDGSSPTGVAQSHYPNKGRPLTHQHVLPSGPTSPTQ